MSGVESTSPRKGGRLAVLTLLLPAIALPLLGAAIYSVQLRIDERFGSFRATEEVLYIQDGKALKKVLLGFESLAADVYWLRTVQYFGGKRRELATKSFDLLAPLLEITTDLDPHMKIAYTYGVTFLSEGFPRGAGNPFMALELIDKGIANNPDYWRFYLDKGFIYFWYLQDYRKAADVFLEGSKIEGAPEFLVGTASRTLTKAGDRETARHLWTMIYETAEHEQIRGNALIHLQQLDALDAIDELTERLRPFQERFGRFPRSWDELEAAGILPGVPVDPTGTPYVLNWRAEKIEVSLSSRLAGLPTRH